MRGWEELFAEVLGSEVLTLNEVMERMEYTRITTVRDALLREVRQGNINRAYGVSKQGRACWLYAMPEIMPRFPMGLTEDEEAHLIRDGY